MSNFCNTKNHTSNLKICQSKSYYCFQIKEPQQARLVKITKWVLFSKIDRTKFGCEGDEALQGIMSYFHEENQER